MVWPLTLAAIPVGTTSAFVIGVTGGTTGLPGCCALAETARAEPRTRTAAPRVNLRIVYSVTGVRTNPTVSPHGWRLPGQGDNRYPHPRPCQDGFVRAGSVSDGRCATVADASGADGHVKRVSRPARECVKCW